MVTKDGENGPQCAHPISVEAIDIDFAPGEVKGIVLCMEEDCCSVVINIRGSDGIYRSMEWALS